MPLLGFVNRSLMAAYAYELRTALVVLCEARGHISIIFYIFIIIIIFNGDLPKILKPPFFLLLITYFCGIIAVIDGTPLDQYGHKFIAEAQGKLEIKVN